MGRTCQCQVQIGDTVKCMHVKHEKFQKPIKASDCYGCPLKVALDAPPVEPSIDSEEETLPVPTFEPEPKELTTMEKAKSLGSVMLKPTVLPGDMVKERRDLCNACPQRSGRRCKLCSCNIYAKTLFTRSACPMDLWDMVEADFHNLYKAKFGQECEMEFVKISGVVVREIIGRCETFDQFKKEVTR